jgi:PAS domain-containing protein
MDAAGATMIVDQDGMIADADERALEILGVTLDQLRSLPPGSFSPEPPDPAASAEFRESWEAQRTPDLVGESTIKLLDGTRKRVKFAIAPVGDGRFRVIIEPTQGSVEQDAKVYTAGQVLGEWRAAERRLTRLADGSAEAEAVLAEIERFRRQYQAFFDRSS